MHLRLQLSAGDPRTAPGDLREGRPALLECWPLAQHFLSHLRAPGLRPAARRQAHRGKTLGPCSKGLCCAGPARRALLNVRSPCELGSFLLTSFSAYFQKEKKKKIDVLCHPELAPPPRRSVFSPFCAALTAWPVPTRACTMPAAATTTPARPAPSRLGHRVCPENSKLLFSAQNAFAHMNAPAVPGSHKPLGGPVITTSHPQPTPSFSSQASSLAQQAHEKTAMSLPARAAPSGTSSLERPIPAVWLRNSLLPAPETQCEPVQPRGRLAPTPAVQEPAPKIARAARLHKATRHLKSSQLECDACSFQACLSPHFKASLYENHVNTRLPVLRCLPGPVSQAFSCLRR